MVGGLQGQPLHVLERDDEAVALREQVGAVVVVETVALHRGIVSNWRKRSAKRPEQMTAVRATC